MSNTMHKFFRKETQTWENVEYEDVRWEAIYSDGTVFKQFADDGIFHQVQEIDRKNILFFRAVSDQGIVFSIEMDPRMKPIFFFKNYSIETGEGFVRFRLPCIGYQNGKQKALFWILPNSEILHAKDLRLV